MKQITIIRSIGAIFFVGYIILLVLHSGKFFEYFRYDIASSIIFAILSIILLYKGIIVHSQSTCWFGLNMILVAIVLLIFSMTNIAGKYDYLFGLIPIFSSLIIIAVYSNLLYIKVIILNVSILIPIVIVWYISIDWWWQIVLYAISIILGIIVCRNINISKESRGGKI